jgi:hypothetical protein
VATTEADAAEILGVLAAAEPRLAGAGYAHREQDRHDLAVLASLGEQA